MLKLVVGNDQSPRLAPASGPSVDGVIRPERRGIYVLSRVREGTSAGAAVEEGTRFAVAHSGRTAVFTALPTTVGILCFVATDLRFVGEMAPLLAPRTVTSCPTAVTVLPELRSS